MKSNWTIIIVIIILGIVIYFSTVNNTKFMSNNNSKSVPKQNSFQIVPRSLNDTDTYYAPLPTNNMEYLGTIPIGSCRGVYSGYSSIYEDNWF